MKELDNDTHERIIQLCDKGDQCIEKGDYKQAIKKFSDALSLVPSPKTEWEAGTWIYAALGDAYFCSGDVKKASDNFYNALNCPDGISNPYVLLKLGESLYESGKMEQAQEYLLKAYMLEGKDIFEDEEDKYFNAIKNII